MTDVVSSCRPVFTDSEMLVAKSVLSMLIGESHDRRLAKIGLMKRALVYYAGAAVPVGAGLSHGPGIGVEPGSPVEDVQTALRRLGVERHAVRLMWLKAVREEGMFATLPVSLLDELVPVAFQEVVVAMLREGPELAAARAYRAAEDYGSRELPGDRTKSAGPPAHASVEGIYRRLMALMKLANHLRNLGRQDDVLAAWIWVPARRPIPWGREVVRRPRPSLDLVRFVWSQRRDDLERRLQAPIGELVTLAPRLTDAESRRLGIVQLRRFMVLTMFFLLGGRSSAMADLRRASFVPDFRTANGPVRAALLLVPGKTVRYPRAKILPPEVARLIEGWFAACDRWYGPLGVEAPFFPSRNDPTRPMNEQSFTSALRGCEQSRTRPILPLDPSAPPGTPWEGLTSDQRQGYTGHGLRRAASEVVVVAYREWLKENPSSVSATDLAEIFLDHDVPSDRYGYFGMSSEEGRERHSEIAIAHIWRMLSTDAGARRAPDGPAIADACRRRDALQAELDELIAKTNASLESAKAVSPARMKRDPSLVFALAVKNTELNELVARERRVREEVALAEAEVKALKTDRERWRIVGEWGEAATVDPDLIEIEISGTLGEDGRRRRPVRNFITTTELARLHGVSPNTARVWLREGRPGDPDDPRGIWLGAEAPVDRSLGPRRQKVLVSGLNLAALTPEQHRKLQEMLAVRPHGWPT